MDRILSYTAEKDYTSIRSLLKEQRYPQAVLSQLKREPGQLTIENRQKTECRLSEPLFREDRLQVVIREEKEMSGQIVPIEKPLKILYEDEDLLVMDKAAGMAVHPSLHHRENSLANAVMYYMERQKSPFVFRCIHRLDKETSGVILVAKNMLSGGILAEDMQNRKIRKTYLGVCDGLFSGAGTPSEGWIDVPIGRMEGSVILRCVDFAQGQPSRTAYRVLREGRDCTLVEFRPETGRCHQIRIHAGFIGHPLLGDYLYHPCYEKIHRVALHAWKLTITHPVTGKEMTFESPMPKEFQDCLK